MPSIPSERCSTVSPLIEGSRASHAKAAANGPAGSLGDWPEVWVEMVLHLAPLDSADSSTRRGARMGMWLDLDGGDQGLPGAMEEALGALDFQMRAMLHCDLHADWGRIMLVRTGVSKASTIWAQMRLAVVGRGLGQLVQEDGSSLAQGEPLMASQAKSLLTGFARSLGCDFRVVDEELGIGRQDAVADLRKAKAARAVRDALDTAAGGPSLGGSAGPRI